MCKVLLVKRGSESLPFGEKSMKKTRVGFIGCGGIAQYHFGHFDKMKDKAQIVAACDLIEERAQETAKRFGAKAYLDYKEMFAKEKLDALFICVQPAAHDGMELIAIDKKIPFFVQKPMSLDIKYAKKVAAGIKKNKLITAVGLQCRYCDTCQMAQRWAANHPIGVVTAHRLGGMPMVWWWRVKEQSGGQAVEQTIHDFDMMRYIFGDVVRVQSIARHGVITGVENYNVDDASSTLLTFKNGAIGTMSTGCFGNGEHSIIAYSPEGKMTFTIFGSYKIEQPHMKIEGTASNDYGQECTETFIDAVRGDIPADEILSPYSEAMKSLELVLAVNKSIDNGGQPVDL